MKYDERACKFNMDTGCVELLLRDGRKVSIDCKWGVFICRKNERRIADNETDFYSARCFAR